MMYHLYRFHIMSRRVVNGEVNHRNEVAGRLKQRESICFSCLTRLWTNDIDCFKDLGLNCS